MPPTNTDMQCAKDEILVILRKYDLAGLATLVGPQTVDTVREFSPSWSCAKLTSEPDGRKCLSMKANVEDSPSLEAHRKRIADTMGIFFVMHHQAGQDVAAMAGIIAEATKDMDIRCQITEHKG